ncbi:hypothetical protein [Streptobacillus notomytis]|uniref:hypothetical protein n=1 Tax=Streptobacillus notomytis TaxID=1712031 RepID=UPI0009375C27|nr:hypothetical protein [Streptobacillus notomytis]
MKNIKKILGILTAFGALLPLLKITISPVGFGTKTLTLGLINLGFKANIIAFIIAGLALYMFYLSDFLQEKISIVFVTLNLVLVTIVSLIFRMEVKKIFSQNLAIKLLNINYSYSWGWIILFLGTLGSFIIVLFEIKKTMNKKEVISEIKPENNEIEL